MHCIKRDGFPILFPQTCHRKDIENPKTTSNTKGSIDSPTLARLSMVLHPVRNVHCISNTTLETSKGYLTPWIKWSLVNPTDAPRSMILDFLTDLYHKGLQYRTINVYKSALSVYHNNIQGVPVGQLREVCELMSGIDNLRPPQPKYSVIWEVDSVLNYLKNLGESNKCLKTFH